MHAKKGRHPVYQMVCVTGKAGERVLTHSTTFVNLKPSGEEKRSQKGAEIRTSKGIQILGMFGGWICVPVQWTRGRTSMALTTTK